MPTVTRPTQPVKGGGTAFGVTSLVTGIVSVISGWIPFLSIPLGAVAIVFGFLGIKKPDSKGMAIAGLITGIVGAVTGIAVVIFWIVALSTATSAPDTYMPMHYYYY